MDIQMYSFLCSSMQNGRKQTYNPPWKQSILVHVSTLDRRGIGGRY
jgi:hypothetical protein